MQDERTWVEQVSDDDMWIIREAIILMGARVSVTKYGHHPDDISERVTELGEALGVTA